MRPAAVFKCPTRVSQPSDSEVELQVMALAIQYPPDAHPASIAHTDCGGAASGTASGSAADAGVPAAAATELIAGSVAPPAEGVPGAVEGGGRLSFGAVVAARGDADSPAVAHSSPYPPRAHQPVLSIIPSEESMSDSLGRASTRAAQLPGSGPAAAAPAGGSGGRAEELEVQLVPLSFVPGSVTVGVLGPLSLHLIKETWTLREEGGVANFCHAFVAETHAFARAHIAARGGNAALSFVTELKLVHQSTKNHAYGVMHCHADAVVVRSISSGGNPADVTGAPMA